MRQGYEIKRIKEICKKGSSNVAQKDLKDCDGEYPIYGASGFIKKVNFFHQEEECIGLVKDGAGVGRVLFLPPQSSVIGTLQYIKPNEGYDIRYIGYCLQSINLSKYSQGATIPHIYFKDYGEEQVVVATDTLEQQRIVDILDAEFAKIDALQDNAEKNLQNAKDLFQAVLRRKLYSTYTQPLVDVCLGIVDCPHSTPKKSTKKTEYPCIRTSELGKGEILWSTMQYVDEDEYLKRIGRMIPQYEDIVYGREGTIGNAVLIPKEHNFCLGQRTTMFRPNKDIVDPKYLLYAILSPYVYDQAMMKNNGCGVAHVNVADIKQFRIPMKRTIAEQQRVVGVLDRLNTNCKILNENFLKTMILCDDLKQALLRKAFNGEL